MSLDNEKLLSRNAMRELFDLNYSDKKAYDVDYILQITHIQKCEQNRKGSTTEMYTCTLSDSLQKYNGFILFREPNSEVLEINDIIKIINLTAAMISNQKNRVFIIKKYERLSKQDSVIGSPIQIKDESKSQIERESEAKANKMQVEPANDRNYHNGRESNHSQLTAIPEENSGDSFMSRSKDRGNKMYTPLKYLTTFSKDFRILVRVIKKSEMKTFNSSPHKNAGTLFSFVVLDEEGYEMQITCFNKAVNKFFRLIQENKVYEINGGYVKINDRKFTSVKADYKVVIDENSEVTEKEDDGSIQFQKYEFKKISDLSSVPLYSVIDTLGYVEEVSEKVMKNTKNGEQPMRKMIISDTSSHKIELTLWRNYADRIDVQPGQILVLKNVKVGDFNGRNISTFDDSLVFVDPIMKEVTELRLFRQNFQGELKDLSKPSTEKVAETRDNKVYFMKDVLESLDDVEDKGNLSRIKATVTQIMHNEKNFYAGCPDQNCKKKLQQDTYNWFCQNCNKTYDKPTYYYTLSIRVKDCSFEHWIDIFGKVAENLLKITAEEYKDILIERDEVKLKEITSIIEFKTFFFLVKPKMQFYNTVPKKKLYAYKIETVDINAETKRLIRTLSSSLIF